MMQQLSNFFYPHSPIHHSYKRVFCPSDGVTRILPWFLSFYLPPCQVLMLEHVTTGLVIERLPVAPEDRSFKIFGCVRVWTPAACVAWSATCLRFFSGCSKGRMPRSYRDVHQRLFAPNLREDRDDDDKEDELGRVRGRRQEIVEGRQVGLRRIALHQYLIHVIFLSHLWKFANFHNGGE